ncbi:bacteriophage T4 gp5 trimerisation domain-containing protein, partial [Pseudomonas aeruginosa]
QRDWDENIEHDQKIRVGHERHDTVEGDSYSEFRAEEQRTVHADRKVELKAADHLSVADALHLRIGTGQFVEAGDEIHFKAGDKVVIEAGMELTLKGGGSFARLDPGGVTLDGAQVMINSGGSPGIGSGVRALSPLQPLAADAAAAGGALLGAIAQKIGEAPQKLLRFELSPLPGVASAARQPYRLYANGALKEEGIADEGGAISFEPLPGERTYRIETANGHAYEVEMVDRPDALQVDDRLAQQGFRDYRAEMPQHKPRSAPDAYRRDASRPGAADKDDPTP